MQVYIHIYTWSVFSDLRGRRVDADVGRQGEEERICSSTSELVRKLNEKTKTIQ